MDFYRCNVCNNLITNIEASGLVPDCCGQQMTHVIPNKSDAASKEHVPIFIRSPHDAGTVNVAIQIGNTLHPMSDWHHIKWVIIETDIGFQIKYFDALQDPIMTFCIDKSETIMRIYLYCNLHGLWERNIFE